MIIGLLGLGTIGSGIYEHLLKRDDIRVKRILELLRHPGLEHLETSDYNEILNDPEIDTVVELIGGMEPAHTFTIQALKAGKNVVSANKLMFSHHMEEILTLAREMGVQYRYDASVGGSIPFLHNLMRHRSADRLVGISGIVNGTTNLILDVMQTEGRGFGDVLAEAQKQGYAEANPSADVDGIDAECKIAIASTVAYQRYVRPEDVDTEGIRNINAGDIIHFKQQGKVCRLLANSVLNGNGSVCAWVEPTLVAADSTEAAVHMNNNTISVTGEYFGVQTFQGQGAGKDPTAFAVELGLRDILEGVPARMNPIPSGYASVDNRIVRHRYYLRTKAHPGVPVEEKLGPCGDKASAYITESMTVRDMHDLAKALRESDPGLFFAGIRD
ncbi:MAG: homoserine dehydrogenase [Clostridia bacterium]|nr:homoserine dehydrogenase [Clostridia bacterium]